MKSLVLVSAVFLFGLVPLQAQQGRGGKPLAWNDKNKDGICDITNKPVGQNPGQGRRLATGRPTGQVPGHPPFAWGDKNKDGICDFTGQPVGQGRMGWRAGSRAAGGFGYRGGRGRGRGGRWGGGRWMNGPARPTVPATAKASPPQKKTTKK